MIPLIFSSTRVLQLLFRNRRVFVFTCSTFFSVHGFYFVAVANGRDFCALVVSNEGRILPSHRGQRARIMRSHCDQLVRIMRSRCRNGRLGRITHSRHGQLESKRIAPSCRGKRTRTQPFFSNNMAATEDDQVFSVRRNAPWLSKWLSAPHWSFATGDPPVTARFVLHSYDLIIISFRAPDDTVVSVCLSVHLYLPRYLPLSLCLLFSSRPCSHYTGHKL